MNVAHIISRTGLLLTTALLMPYNNCALAQVTDSGTEDERTASQLWVESRTEKDTARTDIVRFNPEEFQVQKLWRNHDKDSLFPHKFRHRLYFGASAGIYAISDRVSSSSQAVFNAFAGYRFNPVHSLRLNLSYSNLNIPDNFRGVRSPGIGLDYVASLSNLIQGYNPERVADIAAVVGFGARFNIYNDETRFSPYAKLGLHLGIRFSNQLRLFIEPYAGLTNRQEELFKRECPSHFNIYYGFMAGIQYDLDPRRNVAETANKNFGSWFLDYSYGWHLPLVQGADIHWSGVQSQLSIGCWLAPVIGLRLGGVAQEHWHSVTRIAYAYGKDHAIYRSQHMASIRGELMLNIPNMFRQWRKQDHWFDFNIMGGASYGWIRRDHLIKSERVSCSTWAYTAAAQTLFRVSPDTWLYLEPRFERSYFDLPNGHNTPENSMTLSIGTRLYRSDKPARRIQRTNLTHRDSTYRFRRNVWVGANAGMIRVLHGTDNRPAEGGTGFSPSFGAEAGYDLHPLASFRGTFSYGMTRFDMERYNILDLRLSYMLNLSNAWQGQTPKRRFDIYWNIGPAVTFVSKDKWNSSIALWTSLQGILRVTPKWDLYAEPILQYNLKNGTNPGNGQVIDKLKTGVLIGTRYHF